ncbi:MAG: type VI secretion system ATPase TssH, partial [Gemmatimonadetes bacterium]|nr:type VI secretion system ATPase TssH [Gemmatimonadota bacterium]
EFLNRIDDTVLFSPLSLEEIEQIVDLLMARLSARLEERGIELRTTAAARTFLAREGYDPVYGARPLQRFIQHEVETALARRVLAGEIPDGSVVVIDDQGGKLAFDVMPPAPKAEPEPAQG